MKYSRTIRRKKENTKMLHTNGHVTGMITQATDSVLIPASPNQYYHYYLIVFCLTCIFIRYWKACALLWRKLLSAPYSILGKI